MNTTDATFSVDVIEKSKEGLVIVDFWAEWCQPCMMLAPVLEKVVGQYEGRVTLVKARTEDNEQASVEFQVSGIPAVFAMLDGQIVDSFQGIMPEKAIRSWIDGLLKSVELMEGRHLQSTDPVKAETTFRSLIARFPKFLDAEMALAELLLEQCRDEECRVVLKEIEDRGFLEAPAERIKAVLELRKNVVLDVSALKSTAESDPSNLQVQLQFAEALAAHQNFKEAFEICLNLITIDRNNTGEKARLLMLDIFRVLPEDSPLIADYRRKLSTALY